MGRRLGYVAWREGFVRYPQQNCCAARESPVNLLPMGAIRESDKMSLQFYTRIWIRI